ncbi:hypothetical protein ROZALSC1DRAFT_27135 [Rozella allomycis CSF55]|uniref:Uncharacterized protein n=1 Tax=Rozella allomycis (strain CSF55) TaxID=988480 RepID=A0A075AZH5_ROZAC|nr:hypothetical protein O9G_004372 [Rozella allomycis CSF55]RKP21472.1 hypothetical protein ROZALSC1DRAFT_27135 [Rozella allomycis CSF55]|eukprot:EPZ35715.1 hypothetical protein O9G_004372 [Rozella allomycis CSF55]
MVGTKAQLFLKVLDVLNTFPISEKPTLSILLQKFNTLYPKEIPSNVYKKQSLFLMDAMARGYTDAIYHNGEWIFALPGDIDLEDAQPFLPLIVQLRKTEDNWLKDIGSKMSQRIDLCKFKSFKDFIFGGFAARVLVGRYDSEKKDWAFRPAPPGDIEYPSDVVDKLQNLPPPNTSLNQKRALEDPNEPSSKKKKVKASDLDDIPTITDFPCMMDTVISWLEKYLAGKGSDTIVNVANALPGNVREEIMKFGYKKLIRFFYHACCLKRIFLDHQGTICYISLSPFKKDESLVSLISDFARELLKTTKLPVSSSQMGALPHLHRFLKSSPFSSWQLFILEAVSSNIIEVDCLNEGQFFSIKAVNEIESLLSNTKTSPLPEINQMKDLIKQSGSENVEELITKVIQKVVSEGAINDLIAHIRSTVENGNSSANPGKSSPQKELEVLKETKIAEKPAAAESADRKVVDDEPEFASSFLFTSPQSQKDDKSLNNRRKTINSLISIE